MDKGKTTVKKVLDKVFAVLQLAQVLFFWKAKPKQDTKEK
jgi:hypothetical protein